MTDALIEGVDQQEALSLVYAQAVAARAGYAANVPLPDRDSVDLQVRAGGAMRPALDLQLKATVNLGQASDGTFRFPLKKKNYEDLRTETVIPRVLVVLHLPRDNTQWMTVTSEELVMRRAAYWLSLRGYEERANRTSVTVRIPTSQQFDVQNLCRLMELARTGEIE